MDVNERSRHQLHQRLREVLGPEAAGTLMAHLPPAGYSELATKSDLRQLEERLELKMDAMRQELRGEIQQVRAHVDKTARTLTLSLVTVMAILNGIVFTALSFTLS
jgi:hypothetical protein